MRILGIDPGLSLTGYGCVELADGGLEPALVEGGVLRLRQRDPLERRLDQLYRELCVVIDELQPDRLIVEKIFTHYKHVTTGIRMGHARGVVLLAARHREVAVGELAPTEIKKATTGHGHASKLQIQLAVMSQFGQPSIPEPPDVADAILAAQIPSEEKIAKSDFVIRNEATTGDLEDAAMHVLGQLREQAQRGREDGGSEPSPHEESERA